VVRRILTIALTLALATAPTLTAQPPAAVALRGVAVSSRGSDVVVTISGSGVLPRPTVGVLQDPPRIYLDFANVTMGSVPPQTTSADAPVVRVRAGAHAAATRIVIDLATARPHRLAMNAGAVNVVIARGTTEVKSATVAATSVPEPVKRPVSPPPVGLTGTWSEIPPVPALTMPTAEPAAPATSFKPIASPPPTPAAPSPSALVGPPPPPVDLERYRKQAWGTLDRLRLQQPLLISLDAGETQAADRMQMAVAEFERLKTDLTAIKPPATIASYHAMLVQSSTLALMAFTLRLDAFRTADPTTTRNASSAAAGAVLLLDRACAVIQCPKVAGR
jgi:AMIN domain-containing protein